MLVRANKCKFMVNIRAKNVDMKRNIFVKMLLNIM